jgi:hypothetical protein
MRRLARRAFLVALLVSSNTFAARPLLPGAAPIVQQTFDRTRPGLRYEAITLDHDHVQARVCAASCFAVRLDPPDACGAKALGPFCVTYPDGAPTEARGPLEDALRATPVDGIWGEAPAPTPAPTPTPPPPVIHAPDVFDPKRKFELAFLLLGLACTGLALSKARRGLVFSAVELLFAGSVTALSWLWLRHMSLPPPATNEPFLYVVDCLFYDQCFTIGPGSSVLLNNGVLWEDILVAVRKLGGGPRALYETLVAMQAVSVGVIFLTTARLGRLALALPTALFAMALIGSASLANPMLDSSTTTLFSVLAAASLVAFSVTARTEALVLGAALIAHGMNGHVSVVSLLPAMLVLAFLVGDSPWSALVVGVSSYFVAAMITSYDAVLGNLQVVRTSGVWPLVGLGVGGLIFGASRVRPVFQRVPPGQRALIALGCLCVPHLLGAGLLVAIRHPVLPGYVSPAVAPSAVLLAIALGGAARRHWLFALIPLVAAVGVLEVVPWRQFQPQPLEGVLAQTGRETSQMTPDGVVGVQRLVERLKQGALGPADEITSRFSFKGLSSTGAVRIERAVAGEVRGFLLLQPPTGVRAEARFFKILPDDTVQGEETLRLASLIDEVFPNDPWTPEPDFARTGPKPTVVGPKRTLAGFAFVVATVVAGLVMILRRPRLAL